VRRQIALFDAASVGWVLKQLRFPESYKILIRSCYPANGLPGHPQGEEAPRQVSNRFGGEIVAVISIESIPAEKKSRPYCGGTRNVGRTSVPYRELPYI